MHAALHWHEEFGPGMAIHRRNDLLIRRFGYGLLIAFDPSRIDKEDRAVIGELDVLKHDQAPIIERKPMAVEPGGYHGMILAVDGVTQDHQLEVLRRESGPT